MKLLSLLLVALVLIGYASTVSGQTALPTRIGWIDTAAFADEKNGIVKYVTALKAAEGGFKTQIAELQGLRDRINAIVTELQKRSSLRVVS